ncbi:hypothetical protein Bca52824_096483 [Brassica carinata]|uniref:Protein SCAR n=1 Tax=Brassica carinata TaxID=52824 RepID=A0A8X7TH66_BRACI|nr:hypothetical protein Bca52824_096483 [Brassica carinata]
MCLMLLLFCDEKKEALESRAEKGNKDEEASEIHEPKIGPGTPDRVKQNQRDFDRTYDFFDEVCIVGEKQSKSQANSIDEKPRIESEEENTSEQGSEADEFVDARNTIESESESELDGIPKPKLEHYFGDISTYCSDDASSDNNGGSEDIPFEEMVEGPRHDNSLDESCSVSYLPDDASVSCCQSDSLSGKVLSHDETFQNPREFSAMRPSLLAEAAFPDETILREPAAAHPWLAGDCANEKSSPEELISSRMSLKDAIPAEKILPEEHLANHPSLAEAVPHEKSLPGESVAKYPSFAEIVPSERILPEDSLPKIRSLAEAVPDNMAPVEEPGADHPSFPKAVQEKKISLEVLDSKNLSGTVPEAVSEEQIPVEGFVGVSPCLAEVVPDECFFTEEPEEAATAGMFSSKVMPAEKLFPEKTLEAPQDLAELPEENILREKSVDYTHPSCATAVSPKEYLSPQVLDSANLSVAEAVSHEQTRLEESDGIYPCLAEAVPDENFLTEEREEAATTYEISQEKSDDDTRPSCDEAESDKNIVPDVLDSENLSVSEGITHEKIELEEFVGVDSCFAEAASDEGVEPIVKILPEGPLDMYPSLEELPEEKISQEKSDDDTRPSCDEAESDKTSSQMFLIPKICPYQKVEPIVKILPEGPLDMYPSLEELPEEKISQEVQPNDGRPPCFSEAVGDEKISLLEQPCSTYPSLEESVPHEKTSAEEIDGTNPFLELAVPNVSSFPDKQGVAHQSSAEAVSREKNLPEESLLAYFSLAEHVFDEKASGSEAGPHYTEESVATGLSFTESISDEEIHGLEAPASTTETGPHNKSFPEEPIATYLSLAEAVPEEKISLEETDTTCPPSAEAVSDEEISVSEAPGYTTEAGPHNTEEPVGTDLSFTESVFDEKIPGLEALVSTTETEPAPAFLDLSEGIPDQQVFLDDAAFLSFAEAIFDQKFSPEVPDSMDLPAKNTLEKEVETSDGTIVEPVNIWSNGGLLGLAPSKPPVFAEPKSVSEHIRNEINEASVIATRKQGSSSRPVEDTENYDTKAAAIEDKTQQTPLHGPSFEEQLAYESSIFGSPTSSPPVEHMKISFSSIDPSPVSKLKLRIPCQPQYNGENVDTFPSFQLVPEASNSDNDDDNSDIFCQSSPCVSDNCLSDSELWESDEDPRESASSLKEVGERRTHGDMGSFPGSFLDLPCYDSVDHHSTSPRLEQEQEKEREQVPEYKPSVSEIIRHWPPNQ